MPPTEGENGAPKEIQVFATKYCRMCATELRNGVFIFGEEGKRLHIPEKIRKTLAILVLEEDTLPKKICTDCCSSLEDYAQYKDTVLDAQEKLASIAKNLQNTQHGISEFARSHKSAVIQFSPTSRKSPKKPEHERETSFQQISDTPSSSAVSSSLAASQLEYPSSSSKNQPKHQSQIRSNQDNLRNIPIRCGFCPDNGEIFSERQMVLAHISKAHLDLRHKQPKFRCSECPKITDRYNALRVHAYKHQLIPGGHSCPESHCNKTYPLKSMLDAHRISKHCRNISSEKSFSCKQCGKRFHTKSGLSVHITTKHVDGLAKPQDPPELIPDNLSDSSLPEPDYIDEDDDDAVEDSSFSMSIPPPDRQRCVTINGEIMENPNDSHKLVCKLPVFVNATNEDKDYDREMQQFKKFPFPALPESSSYSEENKTQNKPKQNKIKSKVWNCNVCDKMLTSNTGYHNHMMVHKGRRFDCDQCGVSYMQKATLLHHKKVHHVASVPKKHKCTVCNKEFYEMKFLTQHMKVHSNPSTEFQCDICQKVYKTGRCLRRHVKLHTSSKKYVCTMCNKGFRVKSKLDEHENSHTGRRPLGCQFCEKAFNGHPNYVKHMRRKHPNEINRNNKIPPPKKSEFKTASEQMIHPTELPLSQSSSSNFGSSNMTSNSTMTSTSNINSIPAPVQNVHVPVPVPAHNSDFQHQHQHPHHLSHNHNHSVQHQQPNPNNSSMYTTTSLPGKNYLNPSGGGSSISSSAMNALDLVDCAIQSALVGESAPNNSASANNSNANNNNTSSTSGANNYVSSIMHSQSEPMELSYKLESSAFQDMPMELTKVFQRDPLELCVRQDLNQLMDLSSRVDTNGIVGMSMNLAGVNVHKLDLTERELMDLSGAFRQPIDLIARADDTPHDLYNEGSLVDLSLRSTFGQDQSASSFLRELIDLSSRSDSFHGELDLTKPHGHHPQHGNGSSHPSQTHHSGSAVSTSSNGNTSSSNISPKNSGTANNTGNNNNHVGNSLQHVVYQDAMFSLQN